jgi:ABC-2 type transport system ATP-binding protein
VEAAGSREEGTVDLVVQAKREHDIRKPVFEALSSARLPILMMKTMDITLEDIFLNLITEEKEVG